MAENNNNSWSWDLSSTFDLAGLAADIYSSYYNYQAQKETNETNYKIFREGLDWNRPINQMIRFKEAGLNPNLMYTQGNAGNATAVPTMKAPQLDLDFVHKLGTIYGIKNMREQNKNLQEQNSLLESQSAVKEQEKKKLELEIKFFEKHGYWPSSEGSILRGGRTLLENIGTGYFSGVEMVERVVDGILEGMKKHVEDMRRGRVVPVNDRGY